jgi:hypothetical protein
MPNWCNNNIRIYGDEGTIRTLTAVLKGLKQEDKVFESLIGLPTYQTAAQYDENWYNTNVNWFGTKWDISYDQYSFEYIKDEISFSCETAWSPPIPFMENLCKMYQVNGYIYYSEGGIGFTGETTFKWQDGELDVYDQEFGFLEGMYFLSKEEFWSEVDYSLDCVSDEDQSLEDFLNQYMFVSQEDKKELTRLYNETIKNNVESKSE